MVKIIAEAGVNHFGNYSLALKLIDAVKDTGSDFIKFQMIDEKELYSPGKYEYGNYDIEEVKTT